MISPALPPGVTVFERGWLSSNNILMRGEAGATALVDSGYAKHATQTVALVESALGERRLDLLLNTHLHSDHCGGNAALQAHYPQLETAIPPGEAEAVARWDDDALSFRGTGQRCERFRHDRLLIPGTELTLGSARWEVHAAPGHDPHSVILHAPEWRTLISADALWQNGFGVVFPELRGEPGFDDVAATFDLIEHLAPRVIIPGHGSVFTDVDAALGTARSRLERQAKSPSKHAWHAMKVLLKFKLLELESVSRTELGTWFSGTAYMTRVRAQYFDDMPAQTMFDQLLIELANSGAAMVAGDRVDDC